MKITEIRVFPQANKENKLCAFVNITFDGCFVVRGLKEFGEPARKALILGEALPDQRARTYGAYYLLRDSTVTTGSFLGAWLWSVSPQANFIGAAVCGALGTVWFGWFVCRNPRV